MNETATDSQSRRTHRSERNGECYGKWWNAITMSFISFEPSYLTDIVTQTSSITSRTRLWSVSSLRCEQPCTRLKSGQRAFSSAAPTAWNSLPPSL